MWRMVAAVRRNLQNIRKSPRVADESMYSGGGGGLGNVETREFPIYGGGGGRVDRNEGGGNSNGGFSIICSVLRTPFSLLSCFSAPHVNGVDGMWVSGEFARISEVNHLMVSDSMRYAILM